MSLDDLITMAYCLVDDLLRELFPDRLRRHGPAPTPADSEVIAIEVVGESLGLDRDKGIYAHFKRYHADMFTALTRVHRTTFARQAANLWAVERALHTHVASRLAADRRGWPVDGLAVDACRLARPRYCERFAGRAAFGYDHVRRGLIYGFRLHARRTADGVIVAFDPAPADVSEPAMVGQLDPPPGSLGIGDRNYRHPESQQAPARRGVTLPAPFRTRSKDPDPERSSRPSGLRRIIETTFGMLAERHHLKRTWARGLWHLCHRLIRKVLSHTLVARINVTSGRQPLHFDALVT